MNNLDATNDVDYECEDEDILDHEDDYDICYECTGYGNDYFINDDGELESACHRCPFFEIS